MATALLVIGEIACFLGHFAPRRRYCTFLSGVTFILSGIMHINLFHTILCQTFVWFYRTFTFARSGSLRLSFHG